MQPVEAAIYCICEGGWLPNGGKADEAAVRYHSDKCLPWGWFSDWQLSSDKIGKLTLFGIGDAGANQLVVAEVDEHWMRRQDKLTSSISSEMITVFSKREGNLGKTIQLGMPRKIEPLFTRVSAVKDGLLAAHKAGSGSPNEVIGNEREVFIRNYLEAAYPKPFRFAGGFVTDSEGRKSGQLDIIVEKLHSISFPVQAGSSERLYLAEMVSAAISVKSNLSAQWKQVISEIVRLDPVKSEPTGFFQVNARSGSVPFFVVSYSGAQTLGSLGKKLNALPKNNCLKAVAVLDSNIFAVQTSPNRWVYNQDESSFFYFIAQLHDEITRNFTIAENIWKYACEITDDK